MVQWYWDSDEGRAAQVRQQWRGKVQCVTDLSVTLAHKVGPGLQDLQKRGRRILAEKIAEKAEENTWIGRMIVAKSLGELEVLVKSCGSTN